MQWEGAAGVSAAVPAAPHPPPATPGMPSPLYSPPKRTRAAAAVPAAPAAAAAAPPPTVLRTSLRNFRIVSTSSAKAGPAGARTDNADTRVRYVVRGCFDGKSFAFRTEPAVTLASEQKRRGLQLRRRRRQDSSDTPSETQSESSGWSSSASSSRRTGGARRAVAAEATEAAFDDELRILYEVDDATTLPLRTLKVDVLVETERVGAVSGSRRRGRRRGGGDRQEVFSSTRLLQSFERDLGEVLRSGPAQRTRPFRLRDDDGGGSSGGQRHVLRFDCSMAEERDVYFELRGLTLRVDSEHCRRVGLLPSSPLYLSAVDTSGGSSDVVATAAALPSPSHEFCTVAFPAAPPAGLMLVNATFGELAVQEHSLVRGKDEALGGDGSDVGRSILFRLMCCGTEQLPGSRSGAREAASGHRELLSFTVPTAALLRKARFAAVGGGVPLSPRCEVSSARSCHAPFSVVAPVAEATDARRSARRAARVELRGVIACDTLPLRADCAARPSSPVKRQRQGSKGQGRRRRQQQRAAGSSSRRTLSDRGGRRRRRSSQSDADMSQTTEGENEDDEEDASEGSFSSSAESSPRHHDRSHSRHRRRHHRRRHSSRESSPTRDERARRRERRSERNSKRRSRRRSASPTSSPPPPPPPPVADYHRHRPPRPATEGPFDPPPPPQPPQAPPAALGGTGSSGGAAAGLRPDASWGSSFQLHGGHATAPPVPLYTLEDEARAAAAYGHGHGSFKGGHGWTADNAPCDGGATTTHGSQNASLSSGNANSVVRRRIHDLNLRLHEVRRRSASFADADTADAFCPADKQQRAHVSPRRAAEAAVPTGSSRHESPLRQRRRSPPRSDDRAAAPDAATWGPTGPSAGRRIRDARAEAEAAGGAAPPLTKLELLQRENDRLHEELTGSNVRRVRSGHGADRRREVSPERQRRSVPVPADAVRTADMVGVLAETTTDQEYRLKKLEGEITSLLKRAETAEISRAAAEISMTCMREATAAAPATDGAKRMSPRRHHHHHHPARGSSGSGGMATPVRPPSSPHASSPRGIGASAPQPPPPAAARFSAGGRGPPPPAGGAEAVGFGGAADTVVQVEGAAVCIGVAGVDYVGGDVPELLKACALGRSADVVFVDGVYQAAATKGVRVESRFFTPLHAACRWNADPTMLRMLLSHGEDVNAVSREGDTPLHLLALCPTVSVECLSVLLQAGANVAAYNARGLAPLHLAALNPCDRGQRFLRFLIYQGGADINQRSQDGVSALLLCEGDHAVCAFLKEGGAT